MRDNRGQLLVRTKDERQLGGRREGERRREREREREEEGKGKEERERDRKRERKCRQNQSENLGPLLCLHLLPRLSHSM